MNLDSLYEMLNDPKITLNSKIPYSHPIKTGNKVKNISWGRVWFSMLLPDDYPLVDYAVDKKGIKAIINDIATKYSLPIATETLTRINQEVFKLGTICPTSFDVDSFSVPPELMKRKKELLRDDIGLEEYISNIRKLGEEYLEWMKVNNNGLYDIVKSGGKSDPMEIGVILFSKGPVVGIDGKISKPLKGCVNDGFNLEDWYASADQSRNVLFVRSIGAAEYSAL